MEEVPLQDVRSGTVVWSGAEKLREHLVPIDELKTFPGNARRGDVERLAESLRRFGQVRAVLVYDDNTIVAGHHITKAARLLGWTHVAAIPSEFASRDEARAYLVADNQLSSLGHVQPVDQISLLEEIERTGEWEGTGFAPEDLEDMRALAVHQTEMVRLGQLKRHPRHYRDHPLDQLRHIIRSLSEHGFYRNVVVARDWTVLAGHGVVEAARLIGLAKVPAVRLDLDPEDPEALKILAGDNELGKFGEADDRGLTEILRDVMSGDEESLKGTGYDAKMLASLTMVTRSEKEIADFDAAAEWIGMPEFAPSAKRVSLVLAFESDEDRDRLVEQLGLIIAKKTRGTWSAWWPPRELEELSHLRFDFGDDG